MRRLLIASSLLIVIAIGATVIAQFGQAYRCRSCDFVTYVAAGERLLDGQPLYARWQMRPYKLVDAAQGRGYVYPPPAASLMVWLAWTPELLWRALNLGSFLAVAVLLVRRHGHLAILAGVAAVVVFPPTAIAWTNGQVTPIVAAGFGFAYLYPRSAWAIAAVLTSIKLFPAVLLVWVLRERGWREVGWSAALMLAIAAFTLPITGTGAWPAFIEAIRNGEPNCIYWPDSAVCTLSPWIGTEIAQAIALLAAAIIAGVALLIHSRSVAFAMLCVAVLVALPDLNWPYWLFLLLAVLVVVVDLRVQGKSLQSRELYLAEQSG
jgi:hypothetical protein